MVNKQGLWEAINTLAERIDNLTVRIERLEIEDGYFPPCNQEEYPPAPENKEELIKDAYRRLLEAITGEKVNL